MPHFKWLGSICVSAVLTASFTAIGSALLSSDSTSWACCIEFKPSDRCSISNACDWLIKITKKISFSETKRKQHEKSTHYCCITADGMCTLACARYCDCTRAFSDWACWWWCCWWWCCCSVFWEFLKLSFLQFFSPKNKLNFPQRDLFKRRTLVITLPMNVRSTINRLKAMNWRHHWFATDTPRWMVKVVTVAWCRTSFE